MHVSDLAVSWVMGVYIKSSIVAMLFLYHAYNLCQQGDQWMNDCLEILENEYAYMYDYLDLSTYDLLATWHILYCYSNDESLKAICTQTMVKSVLHNITFNPLSAWHMTNIALFVLP